MPLPVTIISDVGLPGYQPPAISSGGNVYGVVRADADELDVYKATDPTDSFSVQDAGNGPVHIGTILGYAVKQISDVLHIVAWSAIDYEYYTFNMATDLWAIDELMVNVSGAGAPTFPFASIDVRGDGDVIVEYAGEREGIKGTRYERVAYARREAGVWTTGVAVDALGEFHYGNPVMVKSPLTDHMHMVWQRAGPTPNPPTAWTAIRARTLDPSNVLSTEITTTTGTTDAALTGYANAVAYEDAGTQRMPFAAVIATSGGDTARVAKNFREDGSDNIIVSSVSIVGIAPEAFVNGEDGIITVAEDGGILHRLYSGGGADGVDQDLYYETSTDDGFGWTGNVEEIDAVTVNFISGIIYERAGNNRFAYLYDDAGVQKYNEKDLGAAAAGAISAILSIAIDVVADLKAQGKLDAALALQVAIVADLKATGKLDAALAVAINLAANLTDASAAGPIDAVLPIQVDIAADLKAQGKLDAALAIIFAVIADLKAQGKLDAALAFAINVTADLKAQGKLDAALAIVFSVVADLKADGKLDAALAIVFSVAADLKAQGKLDAALAVVFGVAANLTDASAVGPISAVLPIQVDVVADLKARGKLDAALAIVFAVVADLKAQGKLDAALAMVFGVAADLKAEGKLDAALAIVFAVVADLKADGKLDAALAIVFGIAADLKADGKLDAALAVVFGIAANLTDASVVGPISAVLPFSFGVTADLKATGQLDAALAMVFNLAADLKADGKLDAAAAIVFAVAADLKAQGKLNVALPLVLSVIADLKARGKLDAALAIIFNVAANLTDASAPAGAISAALPIRFSLSAILFDATARRIANSLQQIVVDLDNSDQTLIVGATPEIILNG